MATNENKGFEMTIYFSTKDKLIEAREKQSAEWAADMKKAKEFNDMFELTIEKTDDEIDSLWIADDDNPCFARSAGWMFDENDSTLEALLLEQEVNALGVEELNERG